MAAGPMELLSRARAGESAALGELCALYRNYLRMVVRTGLGPRLRERVELSDVVQEALVEVVRQFPQFTGQNEAALVGWLRRLVGQKLADLGRYHSRAKRAGEATALPLDAAPDAGGGRPSEESGRLLDMLALSQTSPSQAASKREQFVLLADAFAGLPEAEADVLWLYFAENLSFEAIGQRLGLSRKTVRGIHARGLKHLKRSLEGPPGGLLRYDDGSTH
ncbi:MAG TPA: sigma-70 family RNA polymerase sigma factor [Isosphaeraceae bacterium]|nr:sigma-70 family RNA polymerase sigma factor [Isosphaeraceae bacterium]